MFIDIIHIPDRFSCGFSDSIEDKRHVVKCIHWFWFSTGYSLGLHGFVGDRLCRSLNFMYEECRKKCLLIKVAHYYYFMSRIQSEFLHVVICLSCGKKDIVCISRNRWLAIDMNFSEGLTISSRHVILRTERRTWTILWRLTGKVRFSLLWFWAFRVL